MQEFNAIVREKGDAELLQMVYEFDKWSIDMLREVRTELASRNLLPDDVNDRMYQKMIDDEAAILKGKEAGFTGVLIGWLMVLTVIGIFIGYHYRFSRVKSDYSNQTYYKYDEASRCMGSWIFYSSIILSGLFFIYRFIILRGNSLV